MACLYILGKGGTFRKCCTLTHISSSEVHKFFFKFLDVMYEMRDEHVSLPANLAKLNHINCYYEFVGLPGCAGSMDVVHIKWSQCPTGDINMAKRKEGYPTLGFQCITNYNCRILGIFGPMFGSRNDKEILKLDPKVRKIHRGWFRCAWWQYYDENCQVCTNRGAYLICDNGYLQWPEAICPYSGEPCHTHKGYFSTNLKSV